MTETYFPSRLYRIAEDLSANVGRGLRARAEAALDAAFAAEDIRSVAVAYLMQAARDHARYVAHKEELDATKARADAELAARAERLAAARGESDARSAGHIGPGKPGSIAKTSRCNQCQACEEAWTDETERQIRFGQEMRKIADQYEADVRARLFVEWTDALLGTEIAMPDGTRTTWGSATIEQHRLRHDMLVKNVMANAENAARHTLAIEVIEQAGAVNLASALQRVGVA